MAAAGGDAGATEISLAVAARLGDRGSQAVLVDNDEVTPSLAQRLRMPLHPNTRTAIEVGNRREDSIDNCLVDVSPRVRALVGLPNPRLWHELRAGEVAAVVRGATASATVMVNVGPRIEVRVWIPGISAPFLSDSNEFWATRRHVEPLDPYRARG